MKLLRSVLLTTMLAAGLTGCTYSDPIADQVSERSPSSANPSTPAGSLSAEWSDVEGEVALSSYQLPIRYTTVEGDTWVSIAAAFEVKEESLKAFQARNLPVVPLAGTVVDLRGVDYRRPGANGDYNKDESGNPATYVVQAGDNPGDVAARFGIPLRNLVGDNDLPGKWSLTPEDTATFLPGTTLKLQNPS